MERRRFVRVLKIAVLSLGLLLVAGLGLVVSCSVAVTRGITALRAGLGEVEAGWTEEQVRARLGEPSEIYFLLPVADKPWKWRNDAAQPVRSETFAAPGAKKYFYRVPMNPAIDGFGYVILENNRVTEKYFYD